jgi:hypothetical protein
VAARVDGHGADVLRRVHEQRSVRADHHRFTGLDHVISRDAEHGGARPVADAQGVEVRYSRRASELEPAFFDPRLAAIVVPCGAAEPERARASLDQSNRLVLVAHD